MKRWPQNIAYPWEVAPFLRLLLPFVLGIASYELLPHGSHTNGILLSLAVLSALVYAVLSWKRALPGLTIVAWHLLFLVSGYLLSSFADVRNNAAWFGRTIDTGSTYLVRLDDAPQQRPHSRKLPVSVLFRLGDRGCKPATGKAFIYLAADDTAQVLHKGDTLVVPGRWQPITNAGNPFAFDYAGWCRHNNLFYTQYCSPRSIGLYAAGKPSAMPWLARQHDWCMAQLSRYISNSRTLGLVQAMLLGDEVNLDEELRQSYADTGIIHIIAISGGNVSVFFLVIAFLLRWVKHKKYLWVKYVLALPFVWWYVLMAGGSPSAVRAALMFSLLALGITMDKNANSFNQLLATAFLLLCVQPGWLFSTGFQLSLVAVLSLTLFYEPVYRLIPRIRNRVVRYLWKAAAASLAAEILVAPLVIYYFHQFPLLFLIANILALLFMGVVLILGIIILCLAWWPVVAAVVGWVTDGLMRLFAHIVDFLRGYNPPSFHFLLLSASQLMLLYLGIAGFAAFFYP